MVDIDWSELVLREASNRPGSLRTTRHEFGVPSRSRPQFYACENGATYVVKFSQNTHGDGRGIFNEYIVGSAGALLGAPVPTSALVDVQAVHVEELVADTEIALDFDPLPGICHGSLVVGANLSDKIGIQPRYFSENVFRIGALDVLAAWIPPVSDMQWIYNNDPPHEMWSIDHTGWLPAGPLWSPTTLEEYGSVAREPAVGGTQPHHRRSYIEQLMEVTPVDIARLVAAPPDDWGVPLDHRTALASWMYDRRERVAEACS